MKSNYKKLGKNTLIFALGSFTQKAMAFLLVPFYTYVLSTPDYGTSDLIITISSMIWPLFTMLIDEAVLRYSLDKNEKKEQIISIGFYVNLLGFLIMLCFSPLVLLVEALKDYYLLFVLYYFTYSVNSFFSYALRGLEKTTLFSVTGIISSFVAISCNLLFLLIFHWGVRGYLLSYIFAFLITGIIQFSLGKFRSYMIPFSAMDKDKMREMLRYAIPLIPNSISWWISNSSDKLIVSYVCGVAANGIYSVSYKIPSLITTCSSIFSNAWQISAVEGFGGEENRKYFSDVYYKYSTVCMFLAAILIAFNKVVCRIVFSKDFYMAWLNVPVLLFAVTFQIMSGFLGTIYTTAKQTKMVFTSTVIAALSNIVLNIILIPLYGGLGAAWATCISYITIWLIRLIDSRKIMKLSVNWAKEIICNLLLLLQVCIACTDDSKTFFRTFLLMLAIFFIKRDFLMDCTKILKLLKRKIRKE